jgi:Arc/MetJ family transcription regulator
MRTNIIIDETLMDKAMKAGGYKTKKDAVEAGLALLARRAAYREVLAWRGKLSWTDDAEHVRDDVLNTHLPQAFSVQTPHVAYNISATGKAAIAGLPTATAAR